MEEKNWLTVKVEQQDGKPNRKVYSVTDSGREEFRRWLAEPPEVSPPRSQMLVKMFFGNQMDGNDLAALLVEWRRHHAGLQKKYKEEIMPIIQHYSKLASAPEDARFWSLTLDFGMRYAKMVVEWCDSAMDSLEMKGK